jgi:phosphomannomutase
MKKNSIVLFDMDGTLTPPRLAADEDMGQSIAKLLKHTKIGIVTGSDFDYLIQQCSTIWNEDQDINRENLFLMPCNGTKFYSWKDGWDLLESVDMREELKGHFDFLMKVLIGAQFTHISTQPEHPLTGHFISYRGSMVNWCPVGRNANAEQRKAFINYDLNTDMRFRLMIGLQEMVDKKIGKNKIRFALGGNTSIDIYPEGWDKTYATKHFPDHEFWFVGDRCEPSGNDYQIYELLKENNRSFKTTSPEQTIEIIESIIARLRTPS